MWHRLPQEACQRVPLVTVLHIPLLFPELRLNLNRRQLFKFSFIITHYSAMVAAHRLDFNISEILKRRPEFLYQQNSHDKPRRNLPPATKKRSKRVARFTCSLKSPGNVRKYQYYAIPPVQFPPALGSLVTLIEYIDASDMISLLVELEALRATWETRGRDAGTPPYALCDSGVLMRGEIVHICNRR